MKKIIASAILITFLTTTVGWAAPITQAPVFSKAEDIQIPEDYGIVEEIYEAPAKSTSGERAPIVVYIQDAHCNYDAQTHIRKIIDDLQKKYGLELIAFEGGNGKINPVFYRTFPDPKIKEAVIDDYVRRGELNGADAASILNDKEGGFWGVENMALHAENKKAFLEALDLKPQIDPKLDALENALNEKMENSYSPELKEIYQKSREYNAQKMDLLAYVDYLKKNSPKAISDEKAFSKKFPMIHALLQSQEREKKIRVQPVDENAALITRDIERSLKAGEESANRERAGEFANQVTLFRQGAIKRDRFYLWLEAKAKDWGGMDEKTILAEFPEFMNYIQHLFEMEKIKGEELFRQLDLLETDIKEALFQNDSQRELDRQFKNLQILRNLSNLELTEEACQYYRAHPNEFTFAGDDLKALFKPHRLFYDIAEKRNAVLHQNLTRLLKTENKKFAVMITGGFHSQGIRKMLRDDGISYLLITPRINDFTDKSAYWNVMRGNVSYAKYLNKQTLSPEDALLESRRAMEQAAAGRFAGQVDIEDLPTTLQGWKMNLAARPDLTPEQKAEYHGVIDGLSQPWSPVAQLLERYYESTASGKSLGATTGTLNPIEAKIQEAMSTFSAYSDVKEYVESEFEKMDDRLQIPFLLRKAFQDRIEPEVDRIYEENKFDFEKSRVAIEERYKDDENSKQIALELVRIKHHVGELFHKSKTETATKVKIESEYGTDENKKNIALKQLAQIIAQHEKAKAEKAKPAVTAPPTGPRSVEAAKVAISTAPKGIVAPTPIPPTQTRATSPAPLPQAVGTRTTTGRATPEQARRAFERERSTEERQAALIAIVDGNLARLVSDAESLERIKGGVKVALQARVPDDEREYPKGSLEKNILSKLSGKMFEDFILYHLLGFFRDAGNHGYQPYPVFGNNWKPINLPVGVYGPDGRKKKTVLVSYDAEIGEAGGQGLLRGISTPDLFLINMDMDQSGKVIKINTIRALDIKSTLGIDQAGVRTDEVKLNVKLSQIKVNDTSFASLITALNKGLKGDEDESLQKVAKVLRKAMGNGSEEIKEIPRENFHDGMVIIHPLDQDYQKAKKWKGSLQDKDGNTIGTSSELDSLIMPIAPAFFSDKFWEDFEPYFRVFSSAPVRRKPSSDEGVYSRWKANQFYFYETAVLLKTIENNGEFPVEELEYKEMIDLIEKLPDTVDKKTFEGPKQLREYLVEKIATINIEKGRMVKASSLGAQEKMPDLEAVSRILTAVPAEYSTDFDFQNAMLQAGIPEGEIPQGAELTRLREEVNAAINGRKFDMAFKLFEATLDMEKTNIAIERIVSEARQAMAALEKDLLESAMVQMDAETFLTLAQDKGHFENILAQLGTEGKLIVHFNQKDFIRVEEVYRSLSFADRRKIEKEPVSGAPPVSDISRYLRKAINRKMGASVYFGAGNLDILKQLGTENKMCGDVNVIKQFQKLVNVFGDFALTLAKIPPDNKVMRNSLIATGRRLGIERKSDGKGGFYLSLNLDKLIERISAEIRMVEAVGKAA